MSQFLMPSLGSDMTAGTLVEQIIASGEPVKRGDVIAAVETQKGVIEVEVFENGILERWLVDLGAEVPVGTPLAMIAGEGDPDPAEPEIPPDTAHTRPADQPETQVAAPPEPDHRPLPEIASAPPDIAPFGHATAREPTRPKVTPAARRLASQMGIDLDSLGLQPGQIVNHRWIEGLVADRKDLPSGAGRKSDTASTMREAIAAAMTRSKRDIPHYYLTHQIDLTEADEHLARLNADRPPGERLVLGALTVRAIALALKKFPEFNGHYDEDGFKPSQSIHVGVAIHIRSGGLVAPALFDADSRSADDLMGDLSDLVTRVRAGRFRARELTDATITLTSLGARGVDHVTGVIYPPQVAIVGMGTPRPSPLVRDGEVGARLSTTLSLAADHRVSDGHRGALFLKAIDARLQEPDTL